MVRITPAKRLKDTSFSRWLVQGLEAVQVRGPRLRQCASCGSGTNHGAEVDGALWWQSPEGHTSIATMVYPVCQDCWEAGNGRPMCDKEDYILVKEIS